MAEFPVHADPGATVEVRDWTPIVDRTGPVLVSGVAGIDGIFVATGLDSGPKYRASWLRGGAYISVSFEVLPGPGGEGDDSSSTTTGTGLQAPRSAVLGVKASMVPRNVGGDFLFDLAVNGRVVQKHLPADGTYDTGIDSDVSIVVLAATLAAHTFEDVRYPSYTQYPDGSITTEAYDAVIGAVTWDQLIRAFNPISLWRLGETSGSAAADEIGAHNGTQIGSPTLNQTGPLTGDATKAMAFVGNTSFIRVLQNSTGILAGEPEYTIRFSMKTASALEVVAYEERDAGGGNDLLRVSVANGLLHLIVRDDAGTLNSTHAPVPQFNDNAYHEFTVRKRNGVVSFYVDGVLRGSSTLTTSDTMTNTQIEVDLGQDPVASPGAGATWTMANVAIFDKALPASLIAVLDAAVPDPSSTANTLSIRTEFRPMSPQVIRKRIFLSATNPTTVRLTEGIVGGSSAYAVLAWDDSQSSSGAAFPSQHLLGWQVAYAGGVGRGGSGFGIGMVDAYQCRRHLGDTTENPLISSSAVLRLFVGNGDDGIPAFPVGPTETHIDLFYWATTWARDDSIGSIPVTDGSGNFERDRAVTMCLADAMEVPKDMDDVVRLSAVVSRAVKTALAPGSSTAVMHDHPGFQTGFPRGDAFGMTAIEDHEFCRQLMIRHMANLSQVGVGNQVADGVVADAATDIGGIVYNNSGDSNALMILALYWLAGQTMDYVTSVANTGVDGGDLGRMADYLVSRDDGTGLPTFTNGGFDLHPGHYDWVNLTPLGITDYASCQVTGYYAAALIASNRLGYDPGGDIDDAIARYQEFYDPELGHLTFVRDLNTGESVPYGSLLDLLPEFWAVFVLGTELLGAEIVVPTIEYFYTHHMVTMVKDGRPSGRAMKLMMDHGGQTYLPPDVVGGLLPSNYVNGGSQMIFDFTTAALGAYYGVEGSAEFWADRKIAEVNLDFSIHEAIALLDPSPDPTTNPYNGRHGQNFAWSGFMAAFERVSGLV